MDYYYLTSPHQVNGITLTPNVPNVAVRDWWADVEAIEGVFDFSAIDYAISVLPGTGKFSLSVSAGKNTPAWVYAAGAKSFSWLASESSAATRRTGTVQGSTYKMPLPWDAIFMAKWQSLVEALASRYAGNPSLDHVVFGIQGVDQETLLPRSATDEANWKAVGYTNQLIESAWKSQMSFLHTMFPHTKLCSDFVPGGMPFGPPDEGINLMNIAASGLPTGGYIAQNNGLSAAWMDQDILRIDCIHAYQMLEAVGPSVVTAAQHAAGAGAAYLEVYPMDVKYI